MTVVILVIGTIIINDYQNEIVSHRNPYFVVKTEIYYTDGGVTYHDRTGKKLSTLELTILRWFR